MQEFTIWARLHHTAPQEFTVLATAIPLHGDTSKAETVVKTCKSLQEAEELRDKLAQELGRLICERGDKVIDVAVE